MAEAFYVTLLMMGTDSLSCERCVFCWSYSIGEEMSVYTRIMTLVFAVGLGGIALHPAVALADDALDVGAEKNAIEATVGDTNATSLESSFENSQNSSSDAMLSGDSEQQNNVPLADSAAEFADQQTQANSSSDDAASMLPVDDPALRGEGATSEAVKVGTSNEADGEPVSSGEAEGSTEIEASATDAEAAPALKKDTLQREAPLLSAPSKGGAGAPGASVSYRGHVENIGWQNWVSDGEMAGTSGQALRLEALEFSLDGSCEGDIFCQAHVENIGWQRLQGTSVGMGIATVGTHGQALRVEAFKFTLAGEISRWYDVLYRAHVENIGWQDWTSNGGMAGTSGQGLRVESLQIKLVKKGSQTAASDGGPGLVYVAHVQDIGWGAQLTAGETAGTSGQSLRVEALKIWLDKAACNGGISYRAHVEEIGWQDWVSSGELAGTTGQALRVEALQIKLQGNIASNYDVVYRAHVQDVGWQPWTLNGATAGTSGLARRVEAVRVALVPKGVFNVAEGAYLLSIANDVSKNASCNDDGTFGVSSDVLQAAQKFYIREESPNNYSIQSVKTGDFLTNSGGSLAQAPYVANSSNQLWEVTWDKGAHFVNKATGRSLAFSGNALILAADAPSSSAQRLSVSDVQLIENGVYVIKNASSGLVLDVDGASWKSGANIMVCFPNGGGNQAYSVSVQPSGAYVISCAMTGKVLDVVCGSSENGTNVHQWVRDPNLAQLWRASLDRDGNFEFVNTISGKHLTSTGSGQNGANVVSSDVEQTINRKWVLERTSYTPDPVLMQAVSLAQYEWSDTEYLILVDLTNNRTIVFEGGYGNWEPIHNWICSTGAPWSPTVLGDYTVGIRGFSFDGALGGTPYTCYYYTQFYGDFLFHSVPYYQGTWTVQDPVLGESVSHGCVRLETENAKWIYDNIPDYTHVKTYY